LGKVIALKLTDKEERIINRLNHEGISNSELIRDALWHYFCSVNEPENKKVNLFNNSEVNRVNQKVNRLKEEEVNQNDFFSENMEEKKVNQKVNLHPYDKNNEIFYDYVFRLKSEVNQLREESNKLQKDFQEETKNIRKLFDEGLPGINLTKKQESPSKENDSSDVHNAIDEFLSKKENKIRF